MSKHTFKAYNNKGELKISTWTSAPHSYAMECAAYQARLNRFELAWVDISSDNPLEPNIKLRAEEPPC